MFNKSFVWSEMRVKSLSSRAYPFYLKFPKILKDYLVYVNTHLDKSYMFMFGCRSLQEYGDWRVVLIIKEPETNNFVTNELTVDDNIDFFVDSEEYSCGNVSRGRYILDYNAYGEVERLIKKFDGRVVMGVSTNSPLLDDSVRRELYNQLGIAEPEKTVFKIGTATRQQLMRTWKKKKENEKSKMVDKPFYPITALSVKKVIFSKPVTTVIWSDDSKTQVRRQKGDKWDMEKALAMAICKRALGNTPYFNNYFKKWLAEAKVEDPKKKKAEKKRKKEVAKLYGVMMNGTTEEFSKAVEDGLHTS